MTKDFNFSRNNNLPHQLQGNCKHTNTESKVFPNILKSFCNFLINDKNKFQKLFTASFSEEGLSVLSKIVSDDIFVSFKA